MAAQVVTFPVPGGEVNIWVHDTGDVDVSWRDEPGALWHPVAADDVKVVRSA